MQQRKLNTRFLVILTVVVAGSLLVLAGGASYMFRGTAEKHLKMAELYVRQDRLVDAAGEYRKAISRDPRNPETYVKLGEVLQQLSRTDIAYLNEDRKYYNIAMEVDPTYLPPMQHLLSSYLDEAQVFQRPDVFDRIKEIAARIVAIEPNDLKARASLHIAWLQGWMLGIETAEAQVDKSMAELAALQEKDPTSVDLPFILASAKLTRSGDLLSRSRPESAQIAIAEAEQVMQKLTAANPKSPRAHLLQGRILLSLSDYYRSDAAKRKAYRDLAATAIGKAQELAKPEDPVYVDVNLTAAQLAQSSLKVDKAETIYKSLLAQRPDDRVVRLEAARFYGHLAGRRKEGIQLLEDNLSDARPVGGQRAMQSKVVEVQTYVLLSQLETEELGGSKDEAEKKDLKAKIESYVNEVFARRGECPEYFQLKGRLFQVQGDFVQAIQMYTRSAALMNQLGYGYGRRDGWKDDMMFQLAVVYLQAQQTGEARAILQDLVQRYPDIVPFRVQLCRVLLAEGSADLAAPHLQYLEKNASNDPSVIPLLMISPSARKDDARVQDLLGKMAESTREQMLAKAKIAAQVGQSGEALRLCQALLRQNVGDEDAAQLATQVLLQQNKPVEARKLLESAMAANPNSAALKVFKAQLDGTSQDVMEAISTNVDEIKDDFQRELAKARLAEAQGKTQEILPHLQKAEQIKPDASEAWEALFNYYARQKQWDALQPYLAKLTKSDPNHADGLFYQFRLAMAQSNTEKATGIARQLTAKLPEFAQSWLALGQALLGAKKADDAREAFLRVLEKQATNVEAYRGLVECCYILHRYDDAGRYIADARKRLPSSPQIRQMEIEHEISYGQPEKVLGVIEAQLAAQKDKPAMWIMVGRAYDRIRQRKASKGEADAQQWMEKARDHWAAAFTKWPETSEIAGSLANAYLAMNDRDDAESVLQKHLQKVPDAAEPVLMLAEFYANTSQPSHAEMLLRKAIERMRDKPELWQRLAAVQQGQGGEHVDAAIKTLAEAPQTPDVLMQRLEILLQAGKIADAKSLTAELLKTRADDFALINAQAYIAMQEKDYKAARELVEKSLSLKPDNPVALHQRAIIKLKDANPDINSAMVDLRTAMDQAPQSVDLRITAADACMLRRDTDGAIRQLEMAASIAPRNKLIWMRLLDLYCSTNPPRLDDAKSLIEQVRSSGGGSDLDLVMRAAQISVLRHDADAAVVEMRRAVELSQSRGDIVRAYLILMVEVGRHEEAAKEAQQMLDGGADAWWLYHVIACAKAREQHRDEAIALWDKALALADKTKDRGGSLTVMQGIAKEIGVNQALPLVLERAKQDPRWMTFAASMYRISGDMKNAVALIEQALAWKGQQSDDDQMRALQEAGSIYLLTQPVMAEKAIAVYKRILQRNPDDLSTLNNLACVYVDNLNPPDPKTALQYSQRAYELMQKLNIAEAMVMDTHGWVLCQNGNTRDGTVILQDVVQRKPFLEARYHLAMGYLMGNFADAAARQLEEAQAMIAEAEKTGRPVPADQKARIEQAMAKARATLKAQTSDTGKH